MRSVATGEGVQLRPEVAEDRAFGVADAGLLEGEDLLLADIRDAPAMNRAWDAWLDPRHKPARATVEARLADPAWRVEITGVAALPPILPRPAQSAESQYA